MYMADTLSRAPCQLEKSLDIYNIEKELEQLNECSDVEEKRICLTTINKIKQATSCDNIMKTLIATIREGWPEDKSNVNENIKQYWNIRDELVINSDLIFKGNRLLIPQQMRREILSRLHQPHLGIESTLKLARETVYWRGITDEIKQMIQGCDICNIYARKQQREALVIPASFSSGFIVVLHQ